MYRALFLIVCLRDDEGKVLLSQYRRAEDLAPFCYTSRSARHYLVGDASEERVEQLGRGICLDHCRKGRYAPILGDVLGDTVWMP